jgi:hypothetical protein
MKESWLETLWNEEIRRRCKVVDIREAVEMVWKMKKSQSETL